MRLEKVKQHRFSSALRGGCVGTALAVMDATAKVQTPPLLGLSMCETWMFQFLVSSKPVLSMTTLISTGYIKKIIWISYDIILIPNVQICGTTEILLS